MIEVMRRSICAFLLLLFSVESLLADDGIWLYTKVPRDTIRQRYGFDLTDSFLDHMRLSSVRFNSGGSGSFVSAQGLVVANHHVGSDCIQKLSTAQNDYLKNGFWAPQLSDEKACPDLELNVLVKIEDVTAQVKSAAAEGTPAAEANRQRKAKMTEIEKACNTSTGNRCDVVTFFSGGQYGLYQYKKYTDVRLVFAPESAIAAFGGDPDNFTYPRYCLDFAFFRAYENGKPAPVPHFLKWGRSTPREGELQFVSGNPGSTGRLDTVAQLEYQRDVRYPNSLRFLDDVIQSLIAFSKKDAESKRRVFDDIVSYQNSYKAYAGFLRGLKDEKLMAKKREDESRLRKAVADDPAKQATYGRVWDEVAAATANLRTIAARASAFENAPGNSKLLAIARGLIRYQDEKAKPDAQRLREYVTPALPEMEQQLYSPAPLYEDADAVLLAAVFRQMAHLVGPDDPTLKAALAGRSIDEAARYYTANTKLKDVEARKKFDAQDPMIQLARLLDGPAREARKRVEDEVEPVLMRASSQLAQARFSVYGDKEYPDATFTMRLSYGPVKGYRNDKGEWVPPTTDFAGLYRRVTGVEPFALPDRWLKAQSKLALKTTFNYVTTADTHGGNSGSPSVNTKGELVGLLFDGNIEGLPNRFLYTDEQARSVHVATTGIVESLRKVYGATRLLKEIGVRE